MRLGGGRWSRREDDLNVELRSFVKTSSVLRPFPSSNWPRPSTTESRACSLRTCLARKKGQCAQSAGKRGRERERRSSSVEEEFSIIDLMKLGSFVHETTHSLHAGWFLYDGFGERFEESVREAKWARWRSSGRERMRGE